MASKTNSKLDQLLSEQAGYVGLYQLKELGINEDPCSYGLRSNWLELPGVYTKELGPDDGNPLAHTWLYYLWTHDEQGKIQALAYRETALFVAGICPQPPRFCIVAPADSSIKIWPRGLHVLEDSRPMRELPKQTIKNGRSEFLCLDVYESLRLTAEAEKSISQSQISSVKKMLARRQKS